MPGWTEHSDTFTPTEAEYENFELSLAHTLEAAPEDPDRLAQLDSWTRDNAGTRDFARQELTKILAALPDYRRQVFGVVVRGHRMLFVNFLPGADWDPFGDKLSDGRERPIATSDGGPWYWAGFDDLDSAHYFQLDLHGYA